MDLEALAAECRSDAFRLSLAASDEWLRRVEAVLTASLQQLRSSLVVAGNSEQQNDRPAGVTDDGDDDDDDGLGYTIRVSRQQVQSGLDAGEFAPTSVEVRGEREPTKLALSNATSALRLLRNACVFCRPNQAACGASHALRLAHEIVVGCCEWVDVDDDELNSAVVLLAQVALQFLVNCVTGHEANQAAVWTLFFPDHFQKLLVECQEHRKIVAFAVALVLNCVNAPQAADSECAVLSRRVDLVCARNLVITVLQRCLVKPAGGSASAAATLLPAAPVDDEDPAFEWICVLFRVLFEAEYAKDLYNAVGAHMLSKLWSRVTPEQLILLRMLTLWATSTTESREAAVRTTRGAAAASPALFEFLTHTWVYVTTVDDEDRPEEPEAMRKLVWIGLENEAKLLLLDALGELTQVAALIASEHAETLLVSLLDELHRVWQLRRLGAPKPATNLPTSSAENESDAVGSEPLGYRSGIIRAVGNLSFRHTRHQDVVRERGRLTLFLNHCNVDDANPMVREWALVALRNLCEGNEANQQFINALKPQSREEAAQTAGRVEEVEGEEKHEAQ